VVTLQALMNLRTADRSKRWMVSAVTRQASELGRPVLLAQENLDGFLDDSLVFPIARKIEKALSYVASQC